MIPLDVSQSQTSVPSRSIYRTQYPPPGNTTTAAPVFLPFGCSIAHKMVQMDRCALQAGNATLKDKYRAAEVDRFDVQPGVEFPPEYVADLQEQILKELEKSKEFQELLRPGQNPVTADSPVLRLTGTISSFNPGSRKKRYVVGYGAGAAEIYARVVFLDRSTERALMTQEVRAVLSGGVFGGNAMNATQDFAKQVVNTTRLSLRKRLPTEDDSEGTHNAASAALDRQQLTISSKDWEGAERTLNEEGAAGYHLVEVRITEKNSANVVLERLSPKPDAYQYRNIPPLPVHLAAKRSQWCG